jgi:excisionase family DNA binding protein
MNEKMTNSRFLDMTGLCNYIYLSKSSVYKMVSRKEIPHIKMGAKTLFDIATIDRWVLNGKRMDEDIPQLPPLNI